jgi:hypothetical protein
MVIMDMFEDFARTAKAYNAKHGRKPALVLDIVSSIEVRTSPVTRGSPFVVFECHSDPCVMFCSVTCVA